MIASPELLIAAAAEHTKRIKLGTGVISLSYHNPFMVATRIAQLDHQTMGRIMFGARGLACISTMRRCSASIQTRCATGCLRRSM